MCSSCCRCQWRFSVILLSILRAPMGQPAEPILNRSREKCFFVFYITTAHHNKHPKFQRNVLQTPTRSQWIKEDKSLGFDTWWWWRGDASRCFPFVTLFCFDALTSVIIKYSTLVFWPYQSWWWWGYWVSFCDEVRQKMGPRAIPRHFAGSSVVLSPSIVTRSVLDEVSLLTLPESHIQDIHASTSCFLIANYMPTSTQCLRLATFILPLPILLLPTSSYL